MDDPKEKPHNISFLISNVHQYVVFSKPPSFQPFDTTGECILGPLGSATDRKSTGSLANYPWMFISHYVFFCSEMYDITFISIIAITSLSSFLNLH